MNLFYCCNLFYKIASDSDDQSSEPLLSIDLDKVQYSSWIAPSFKEELDEFTAPWWNFSRNELDELSNQLIDPVFIPLSNSIWSKLQNTDSWETTDLRQARKLASEYGKDLESILEAFVNNDPVPTPIILLRNKDYHLIAGNTRLMLCRVLGIRPTVVILKLES